MSKAKHILLYDEGDSNSHFSDLIIMVCRKLGHHLKVVKKQDNLKELLSSGKYDLFIVDPTLLSDDSKAVAEEVDQAPPVVAIKNIDDVKVRRSLQGGGCNDILARYYSQEEIRFVLNNALHETSPGSQRRFPRILAGVPGSVEIDGQKVSGTVINLSEGGAFLKTYSSMQADKEVNFEFDLEEEGKENRIVCSGRIVYVEPYHVDAKINAPGVGVRFADLNEEDAEALQRYIAKRLIHAKK